MYKIKQIPEDFCVNEITKFGKGIEVKEQGNFIYCLLKKKNHTTLNALQRIAYELNLPLKGIGFSGNKDKAAVTEQAISIYDAGNRARGKIDSFNTHFTDKGILLEKRGYGDCPISLGDHLGNEFKITIRNLAGKDVVKIKKVGTNTKLDNNNTLRFVNYYGEQRFSKQNKEIGKLLLQKKFKEATELLIETEGEVENKISKYLENNRKDYVNALKTVPKKLLLMYIHSYQSYIWNIAAEKLVTKYGDKNRNYNDNPKNGNTKANSVLNLEIPIIGFGTEIERIENEDVKKIISDILKKEKITPRDFIIKQIPDITAEGTARELYCEVKDFKMSKPEPDDLNKGKKKLIVEFSLPKASYATEVIRQIFSINLNIYDSLIAQNK